MGEKLPSEFLEAFLRHEFSLWLMRVLLNALVLALFELTLMIPVETNCVFSSPQGASRVSLATLRLFECRELYSIQANQDFQIMNAAIIATNCLRHHLTL